MSGKNKLLYVIIGIILLLVSIKAGLGLQEDFNAYASSGNLFSCMCSFTQSDVVVENIGDVTSIYRIMQEGDGAPYSSLTQRSFRLEPGESKTIPDFIAAPCGIEGKYGLKTTIQTDFGMIKEFSQNLEVKKCANLDVRQVESSPTICPCTPAKFTFRVTNTDSFSEVYDFSVSSKYAALSESTLILDPGQSNDVYVFITTPCGQYGEISFVFSALAENTGLSAEIPFTMPVSTCYDYDMQMISQYSVCEGVSNVIPIMIKNTADIANSYFLSTDSPWAAFETDSVSLWGGNSSILNLDVNAFGIQPASYNLIVSSITGRGGIRKDLSLGVDVENCFSGKLVSETELNKVVGGESNSFTIYLENDGTRESTYNLGITGPEWVSMDKSRVVVKPGAREPVKITLNVPQDASGSFNIVVIESIEGFPEKAQELSLNVETISLEDAYRLGIGEGITRIETNYDGGSLPIDFNSLGIRGGKYNLHLTGESWMSIDKSSLTLNPGESGTVTFAFVPAEDTPEGTYTATIDAVLEDKNIAYSRTFDIVLRQKTLSEKIADFFKAYWLYLLISLFGLMIFTIVLILMLRYRRTHPRPVKVAKEVKEVPAKKIEKAVEKKEEEKPFIEKEKRPGLFRKILIILLILALLAGLGFAAYTYAYPAIYPLIFHNATNEAGEIQEVPIEQPAENLTPITPLEQTEVFTNATIFVNRTGLRGSGNVIEIYPDEEITIPLIIQNNDEPNTYKITISREVDWVRTDRDFVSILPNKRETVNIYVNPDGVVAEGDYSLSLSIDVGGKKPLSEEIVLKISKPEPFYKQYLWYIIGGIAALAVLLTLLILNDMRKMKKAESFEKEMMQAPKKKAKIESIVEEMPKEGRSWKKILLIALIILMALGLVGAGLYFGRGIISSFTQTNETMGSQTGEPETQIEYAENAPSTPAEIPLSEYQQVPIPAGKETVIPIKIVNTNETSTFKITIQDEIPWINVEEKEISIGPSETKTINLIASPDENVESGDYKVAINIDVDNGKKRFDKYFILNVSKNRFSGLFDYLLYVLAGVVLLAILIKILDWKKKSRKTDIGSRIYDKEDEKEIKKTSLKLK